MSSGAGNLSRGMMLRVNNQKLSYMFMDANGNYTQFNASASYTGNDGLLSITAWTQIEIVITRLIGVDNKILINLYFNNVKATTTLTNTSILINLYFNNVKATTTLTNTSTGFDMSYSGGIENNLLRFSGYSESHNIADFNFFYRIIGRHELVLTR